MLELINASYAVCPPPLPLWFSLVGRTNLLPPGAFPLHD